MFWIIYISVLFAGLCHGDSTQPAASPPGVICGELPNNIFNCIGSPKLIKHEATGKCSKSVSECVRMKCIVDESGWMANDEVDKKKVSDYFDSFAQEKPEWTAAVKHVKDTCLTKDLPPQGVYKDCPAYDVMFCALTGFIKKAQPSLWSAAASCDYPRQFAAHCPVCPTDCFAAAIPNGTCNACILLPRAT